MSWSSGLLVLSVASIAFGLVVLAEARRRGR
jgi:hypothetical protein